MIWSGQAHLSRKKNQSNNKNYIILSIHLKDTHSMQDHGEGEQHEPGFDGVL